MDITTLARKWGSRLLKAVWFVLISFLAGRMLALQQLILTTTLQLLFAASSMVILMRRQCTKHIQILIFCYVNICNDRLSHNIEDIQQNQESLIF